MSTTDGPGRAQARAEASPGGRIPWAAVPGARVLVLVALLKGIVLCALIPPFQTPDEYAHYDYALYLSKVPTAAFLTGQLPRPTAMSHATMVTGEVRAVAEAAGVLPHLTDAVLPVRRAWPEMLAGAASWDEARERDLTRADTWNAVMNYPPLYHGLQAVVAGTLRSAGVNPLVRFHAARLLSLACVLIALVAAIVALARLDLPPIARSVALGAIALQPQLSMLSVSVQPDTLALLLVTVAFALALRWLDAPDWRRAAALGAVLGALLITKPHDVPPLVAGTLVGATVLLGAGALRPAAALLNGLALSAALAAVGGWWLLRSWLLHGNLLGLVMWTPAPGASSIGDNLAAWWQIGLPLSFRSYWGVWGWLDYGVDGWMVGPLVAWSLLPLVLIALRAAAEPGPRRLASLAAGLGTRALSQWLLLHVALAIFAAELLWVAATMGLVSAQGRQWLPFVLPQALLIAAPVVLLRGRGLRVLSAWAAPRAARLRMVCAGCLAAAIVAGSAAVAAWPVAFADVRLRIDGDGRASLFHDAGAGFTAAEMSSLEVRRRDGEATLRFALPASRIEGLRLDLTGGVGRAAVSAISVVSPGGARLASVPLDTARLAAGEALGASATGLTIAAGSGAIVEWRLPATVRVAGALAAATEPLRWFWVRVHRRVPATAAVAGWWAPLLLVSATIALLVALRPGARWHEPLAARAAPVLAGTTIGLLVALNAWLATLTWAFYR